MADEAQTKPMLETVLNELREFRSSVEKRFDGIETRLEEIETRLDKTQAIALDVRGDVRELRKHLRDQLNLSV